MKYLKSLFYKPWFWLCEFMMLLAFHDGMVGVGLVFGIGFPLLAVGLAFAKKYFLLCDIEDHLIECLLDNKDYIRLLAENSKIEYGSLAQIVRSEIYSLGEEDRLIILDKLNSYPSTYPNIYFLELISESRRVLYEKKESNE